MTARNARMNVSIVSIRYVHTHIFTNCWHDIQFRVCRAQQPLHVSLIVIFINYAPLRQKWKKNMSNGKCFPCKYDKWMSQRSLSLSRRKWSGKKNLCNKNYVRVSEYVTCVLGLGASQHMVAVSFGRLVLHASSSYRRHESQWMDYWIIPPIRAPRCMRVKILSSFKIVFKFFARLLAWHTIAGMVWFGDVADATMPSLRRQITTMAHIRSRTLFSLSVARMNYYTENLFDIINCACSRFGRVCHHNYIIIIIYLDRKAE